jgi:hypothetical protein
LQADISGAGVSEAPLAGGVPSSGAAPGGARRAAAGDAADTSSEGAGGESESEDLYEDIAPRGGSAPGGANAGAEEEEEAEAGALAVARKTVKKKSAKEGDAAAAAAPAADAPHLSDLDYLRSRVRANFSDDEAEEDAAEEDEEEEDEDDDADDDADADAEVLPDADAAAPAHTVYPTPEGDAPLSSTGRIFARNLAFTATEDELRELFCVHGDLMSVHVVTDKASGRSKGLAYVQFANAACAVEALAALDGCVFQGRLLHLLPAARLPGSEGGDAGVAGDKATAFKAEKEAQLKARGGACTHTRTHALHALVCVARTDARTCTHTTLSLRRPPRATRARGARSSCAPTPLPPRSPRATPLTKLTSWSLAAAALRCVLHWEKRKSSRTPSASWRLLAWTSRRWRRQPPRAPWLRRAARACGAARTCCC